LDGGKVFSRGQRWSGAESLWSPFMDRVALTHPPGSVCVCLIKRHGGQGYRRIPKKEAVSSHASILPRSLASKTRIHGQVWSPSTMIAFYTTVVLKHQRCIGIIRRPSFDTLIASRFIREYANGGCRLEVSGLSPDSDKAGMFQLLS
jgi:hypothetical protein